MSRIRTRLLAALGAVTASLALVVPLTGPAEARPAQESLTSVSSVDLSRYVGQWEQVAAIPQIYQLQCARDNRATYTLVDADTVGVRNTCRTWLGSTSGVTGTAEVRDPATNASLRVSFDGVPAFDDTSKPNYVITYLAPDYSFAVVGDPARRSGFVLSRTPRLQGITWGEVRRIVEARGYDSCRFVVTPVAGGRQDRTPLCLVR
jgi:apolipoprotein D and lipocalin family protein